MPVEMPKFSSRTSLLLAVVLVASACGYSEEEMQVKQDRIDQLTRALDSLESKHADLNKRFTDVAAHNASMREQLQLMGVDMQDQERRSQEMAKRIEELQARERQAQARLATFRNMLEKFRAMIASGKLRVRIVRGRMVVELSENILFDSGRKDLKKEGQVALEEVAGVLGSIADRNFQIAGHTDDVPIRSARFPSNWELSTARAVVVARFLEEKGVARKRLSAAGYADAQPVASNETAEGRAQNRRIEIVLMPNLDELPDLSSLEENAKK
jgi:chemotaxis protein MotB